MIEEKTVFVFGAGLSSEYGFPTGDKLRDEIIELLAWETKETGVPEGYRILEKLYYDDLEIVRFKEELQNGSFDSIDSFLEKRENPRYHSLGKSAIAMALMRHEDPNIFKKGSSNDDFYRFLFNRMVEDATKETFINNAVSFVTFNYDRSFEFFLWKTLCNHFENIQPQEVNEIIKKIKIIHVHGMLGEMEWQSPIHRKYYGHTDEGNLELASKGIVVFNEVTGTHPKYEEARKLINDSKNVVFVGFGFHPLNLSRLSDGNCLDNKKRILATAVGIGNRKMKQIAKISNDKINDGHLKNEKAVPFAHKYLDWL